MTSGLALVVALLAPLAAWRWLAARRGADLLQDQLEQLAGAVREELPLAGALEALAAEAPPRLRRRLHASAEAYRQHGSLGEAVDARPRWCPAPLRALIRAGEQQRALGPALELARSELAEGPALRPEAFQRIGYPAILISLVLWLALFLDEVIIGRFHDLGEEFGAELMPQDATQGISVLLGVLAASLVIWLLALSSELVRRGLLTVGLAIPVVRSWVAYRHQARWLARAGALLAGEGGLPQALERTAELDGGDAVRRAAALAAQGAPLEQTLETALGRSGRRDLPRLLLTVRAHGLGPGCLLQAERLRAEARRRLARVGELLQPVPTLLCGLVAYGIATGVFTALNRLQELSLGDLRGAW